MKIILISGVIGSGKDYWAEQYKKEHTTENIVHLCFAESLRDICEGMFGIAPNDDKAYEAFKAIPANRGFMVMLGANLKRVYGDNFLARYVKNKIESSANKENATFLITDFRLPVEFFEFYYSLRGKDVSVIFCDYHSDRYAILPDQYTEQMAIYFLSKGLKHGQEIDNITAYYLLKEYENELHK